MSQVSSVESIFFAALEKVTPAERAAYLDEACAGDDGVRRRVERLLNAHPSLGSFLQAAAPGLNTTHGAPLLERPGMCIGPYKLLQQIGEGGMGVVYMAEQESPVRRRVALKIIKPGMDSAQVISRFEAERQALAMMDHQNIARVLDAGATPGEPGASATGGGRPYFVMELVHGVPITKYCDDNHLTPRKRLELFVPVCQAVQHAHQKGIIHRDIKPSNVLVCLYDGKPVPKIIDFGVAKATEQRLTERTLFTQFGTIVGTFEYMAPEQAEVSQLGVDTRSDIYSLGVLLYELLTGTTPLERQRLQEAGYAEILRLIREEEPAKPSTRLSTAGAALGGISAQRGTEQGKLTKLVRGELDWIVMKALEKDRTRRYDTATGLADDIGHYLADEPVLACPPSAGYRLRKFTRKHKAAIMTAAAFIGLLLTGTAVSFWQAVQATHAEAEAARQRDVALISEQDAIESKKKAAAQEQRAMDQAKIAEEERQRALFEKQQAELARQVAKENETKAEWRLYASHIASAQRAWEAQNVTLLYKYLNLCHPDFRGWEHDYLYTLANPNLQKILRGSKGLSNILYSPDGKRLVILDGSLPPYTSKDTVRFWDAHSGKEVHAIQAPGYVLSTALSPDGKRLAAACWSSRNKPKATPIISTIIVWDAVSGDVLLTLDEQTNSVRTVAFSSDGKFLAGGGGETKTVTDIARPGWVKVWDAASGREILTLRGHVNSVSSVAFSPNGRRLASADGAYGEPGELKLWDLASGKEYMTLKGHTNNISCVAISPDGKHLASASNDKTVKLWDLASGKERLTLEGHTSYVQKVTFSPDGKRLASGSTDNSVKLWDAVSGKELATYRGHTGHITGLAFSPDGQRLASTSSTSRDGTVRLWDGLGVTHPVFEGSNFAFSPEGKGLSAASKDETTGLWTLKLWDTANWQLVSTLKGTDGRRLTVSPDFKRLAEGTYEFMDDLLGQRILNVRLWDFASGHQVVTLKGPISSVAFSPDGKRLASGWGSSGGPGSKGGPPGDVRVWDAATGEHLLTLKGLAFHVARVAFSPDGTRLAGGLSSNNVNAIKPDTVTVRVWDAASGNDLLNLKGHTWGVNCVVFSPDGKRLASASRDATVKVWDVASGQEVLMLEGHTGSVSRVAFSPDGKRLATSSDDGTLKLWDAASGQELLTLKHHRNSKGAASAGVVFSPDGKRLFGISGDRPVIWDASKSMKELEQK